MLFHITNSTHRAKQAKLQTVLAKRPIKWGSLQHFSLKINYSSFNRLEDCFKFASRILLTSLCFMHHSARVWRGRCSVGSNCFVIFPALPMFAQFQLYEGMGLSKSCHLLSPKKLSTGDPSAYHISFFPQKGTHTFNSSIKHSLKQYFLFFFFVF